MALSRSDVQKVIKALGKAEHHFWLVNYYEFSCAAGYITPDRRGIDPAVLCEGYHWNLCRCLAQAQEWEDLKHHIDIIKFDYLKKRLNGPFKLLHQDFTPSIGKNTMEWKDLLQRELRFIHAWFSTNHLKYSLRH